MSNFIDISNYFLLIVAVVGIAAIGAKIFERGGTAAIQIEGAMVIGGIAFVYAMSNFDSFNLGNLLVGILAAIGASIVYNIIFSIVVTVLKGNQFIVGIGFNIVAPVISFLVVTSSKFQYGFPVATIKNLRADNQFNYLYLIFFIVFIVLLAIMFVLIYRTKFGIKLNAMGENPYALQNAGINIVLNTIKYHILAACFIGVAGAFMTYLPFLWSGNGATFNGMSSAGGLGFIALGVIILSSWKIKWIGVFTMILGILLAIFYNINLFTTAHPWLNTILQGTPYLFTIIALPFISKKGRFPSYLGRPFKKNKRTLD